MGCSESTVEVEFNDLDHRYIRNSTRAVVRENHEVMTALPFVYGVRARQSPSLEKQAVVRKVLRDSISVRSFAGAPVDATGKSVTLLFEECVKKSKIKASQNLDQYLAKDQLSHLKTPKERSRACQESLDAPIRQSLNHVFRHVMLDERDHYEIVPEDEEYSFQEDQKQRDVRLEEDGENGGGHQERGAAPSDDSAPKEKTDATDDTPPPVTAQETVVFDGRQESKQEEGQPATPKSRASPQRQGDAAAEGNQKHPPRNSPRRTPSPQRKNSAGGGESPRKSPSRAGAAAAKKKPVETPPPEKKEEEEPVGEEPASPLQRCTTMGPPDNQQSEGQGEPQEEKEVEQTKAGDEELSALPRGDEDENGATKNEEPAATTNNEGAEKEATGENTGPPYTLPEGDWVDSGDEFFWSDAEQIYYHTGSGMFFDPESNQWYDPESGEWFEEEA